MEDVSFSEHSLQRMFARGISKEMIENVLKQPDQVLKEEGMWIYQSVINENGQKYLIRIFVNVLKMPPMVITAYKTSKIKKYL